MNTNFTDVFNESKSFLQMTNNSKTDEEYVEIHSAPIKVASVLLTGVSLMSSFCAVTFMLQTRKIPYATKFLSFGLLFFGSQFILLSTIRKFITDPVISYNIQSALLHFLQMRSFTVCLMSIERFFVINKPMLYVRIASKGYIRKKVICAWLCNSMLYVLMRYGVCYIKYQSISVFTIAGYCKNIMSIYFGIYTFTLLCIASTCYVNVFRSIKKVNNAVISTANMVRSYQSTYISFIYLITIVISAIGYVIVNILVQTKQIGTTDLRLSVEGVSFFNCILDPFLYVFWFKECRLQFVKCLAICSDKYKHKAEQWRMEIYDIVTCQPRHN